VAASVKPSISNIHFCVPARATNGVAARLKRLFPFMMAVHRIAQRLSLAAGGASNSLPFAFELDDLVNSVAAVFSRSAKKSKELEEILEEMALPVLSTSRIMTVRWLSRNQCITKLCRVLPAVLTFMQKESPATYDPLQSFRVLHGLHFLADGTATLARLSKVFQAERVDLTAIQGLVEGAKVDLTEDFLGQSGPYGPVGGYLRTLMGGLDKQQPAAERESLAQWRVEASQSAREKVAEVEGQRREASPPVGATPEQLERVRSYLWGAGEYIAGIEGDLREVLKGLQPNELSFHGHKVLLPEGAESVSLEFMREWIQKVISNLEARFAESPLITALGILAPDAAAFLRTAAELASYGWKELEFLFEHYGKKKMVNGVRFEPYSSCDYGTLRQEFRIFKQWASTTFFRKSLADTWSGIASVQSYYEQVPNLIKLAFIGMVCFVSTAYCERGFSRMNLIKSKSRNSMKIKLLDNLMRVGIVGPKRREFDFKSAISIWQDNTKSRKRVLYVNTKCKFS
jgi:hypothetical protein